MRHEWGASRTAWCLAEHLKSRKLDTAGKKADLVARLKEALAAPAGDGDVDGGAGE